MIKSFKNTKNKKRIPNNLKYMLLDSHIISRSEGVHLVVGNIEKDKSNPLFGEDEPWEPRFDNLYPNVIFDEEEELYKCWYSPFIIEKRTSSTPRDKRTSLDYRSVTPQEREMGVCYAISKDGIVWEKPELGLVEFSGFKKNNIVMREAHGAGVWKDLYDPNPARRYKMFFKSRHMSVSFSSDGLHWTDPVACPQIKAKGDTHNNTFWAPELGKYVGITRLWDGQRIVGRTESTDFIHWTKAGEVLRGTKRRQTYAMPVFRYANVYLGLIMIFNTDTDTVDCELAWSHDTVHWERVCPGTPFIPRGPKGSYDSGCIYAAAYPIVRDGEIRLYYGGNNGKHSTWRDGFFCMAHLRPDGFAPLEPLKPDSKGTVLTKPIECIGRNLQVNVNAALGSLRVAILNVDGFGLNDCEPIDTNVTDRTVRWKNSSDLSEFLDKPIRLQFELNNSRLYAFSFSST